VIKGVVVVCQPAGPRANFADRPLLNLSFLSVVRRNGGWGFDLVIILILGGFVI
jgi:hypothetical protein